MRYEIKGFKKEYYIEVKKYKHVEVKRDFRCITGGFDGIFEEHQGEESIYEYEMNIYGEMIKGMHHIYSGEKHFIDEKYTYEKDGEKVMSAAKEILMIIGIENNRKNRDEVNKTLKEIRENGRRQEKKRKDF